MLKDILKKALEKDGWKITHDPYCLSYGIFEPAKTVINRYSILLIIYNPNQEVIEQWIK